MPFETFPLESVLNNGETILFANKDDLYYAHYKDGILINHSNKKETFKSLTAFCNRMSGTSINGWKVCKVYRDGEWLSLQTLRSEKHPPKGFKRLVIKKEEESDNDADIESETEMPPKRAPVVKTKSLGAPITVPFIRADIIESDEPSINVESITKISLKPRTIDGVEYLYDASSKRVYNKVPNGIGEVIGVLDATGRIIPHTD